MLFKHSAEVSTVALILVASISVVVQVSAQLASDSGTGRQEARPKEHLELQKPKTEIFTALTGALPLYPGEVTNTFHTIKIPPGPIAIYEFSADIVEKDAQTGEIIPVPLKDAYLHHHVVLSGHNHYDKEKKHWWSSPMKPKDVGTRGVGFGAGTESRGTKQTFPFPYAFTTVEGEDELIANVHVINTREMDAVRAHRCLECPCTLEDRSLEYHKVSKFGFYELKHLIKQEREKGTSSKSHVRPKSSTASITGADSAAFADSDLLDEVLSRREHWDQCNDQLREENNTACSPSSYYGGLICCEHGEFCLDELYLTEKEVQTLNIQYEQANETGMLLPETMIRRSTFYLRYNLSFSPVVPENKPLYLASCCDATGNLTKKGNVEYDIAQLCDPGDPDVDVSSDACVHELTTVQPLHKIKGLSKNNKDNIQEARLVDVVYMVGHLHRGGIEISAYNEETGELICKSLPTYGTGAVNEIGNEPGYINSMSACSFDPPLRMKTTDRIKVVGRYNATKKHTGVMSLFYAAMNDVLGNDSEKPGFWKQNQIAAILLAVIIVVVASFKVINQYKPGMLKRKGYEPVPNSVDL